MMYSSKIKLLHHKQKKYEQVFIIGRTCHHNKKNNNYSFRNFISFVRYACAAKHLRDQLRSQLLSVTSKRGWRELVSKKGVHAIKYQNTKIMTY